MMKGKTMSKDEMIKWLQNLKKDIGQTQHQDLWHYAEMLDEVIGALKDSGDAISREAVMDIVCLDPGITSWQFRMLKELPNVIPETGDSVSKRYLLAEIDDLADEFSEVDENGLHSERWCGIMDSKGVIVNAPSNVSVLKKGKWVTKTVKKDCAPDCWYPGIFAIKDSWNEEDGSWLEEEDGFCSECGEQDEHYGVHKYCPNCGAKMEG